MKAKKTLILLMLGLMLVLSAGTITASAATEQTILTGQLYFMEPGESLDDSHFIYFNLDKPAKIKIHVQGLEFAYNWGGSEFGSLDVYLDPESEKNVGDKIISYSYGWRTPQTKEVVLKRGMHRLLVHTDLYIDEYSIYIEKAEEYVEGPATAITLDSKAVVTKGMKLQLQPELVNCYETLTGMKWKTSKKSVATVNSKGIVTAKKTGTAKITCILKNGKKYTCKVTVKDNVFKGETYSKLNARDYRYGQVWLEPLKISYSGKKLKVECAALNARILRATSFKWITLTVYDKDNKVIAKNKFKNVKLNIGNYGKKKITFTFPASKVKKKNYDLRSDTGIYIGYDYYYNFQYTT